MMDNPKLNPLKMPEIISLIGTFLDRKDVLCCIRVSKAFHDTLFKFLWKEINVKLQCPTTKALENNKKYIEELVFQYSFPKEYRSLQGCAHLQHINYSGLSRHSSDLYDLSNLIKAHRSTITKISFCGSSLREIWGALVKCIHLETLVIIDTKISNDEFNLFSQVCKSLKRLEMYIVSIELPLGFLSDDTDAFIFPNMTTLFFEFVEISNPPHPYTATHCFGIFIRRCPGLRLVSLSDFYMENFLERDQDYIDFERAASLHHPCMLINPQELYLTMETRDEDMAALLKQMTGLRELHILNCDFGPLSMRELLAEEREILKDGFIVRESGCRRLCDTIEQLTINSQSERANGIVQAILSNCPRLKHLRGSKITVTEIVDGAEWVSIGLITLTIQLESDVDTETEEGMEKQRAVFRQLGKLTQLTGLGLTGQGFGSRDVRTLDLSLRAGLDELINLKRLGMLLLQYDEHQQIQLEDAEWIVTNWPNIKHWYGVVSNEPGPRRLVTEFLQSHDIVVLFPNHGSLEF